MNVKIACTILGVALLVACGKPPPLEPAAAPSAPAQTPAPAAAAQPQGDAILIGGHRPTFPNKVRSQRTEGLSHFVVLEYLDIDRDAAIASLAESMSQAGFKMMGPKPREGGVQYVYVNPNGQRMSAIFADDSRKLVNRRARGVVMFGWTDAASQ
jgi:hypothetical protein